MSRPSHDLVYLRLLRQRAGQVLRREFGRARGGGLAVGLPKGRREGGVAGEERGSGETNSLVNQRRWRRRRQQQKQLQPL